MSNTPYIPITEDEFQELIDEYNPKIPEISLAWVCLNAAQTHIAVLEKKIQGLEDRLKVYRKDVMEHLKNQ